MKCRSFTPFCSIMVKSGASSTASSILRGSEILEGMMGNPVFDRVGRSLT